MVRELGIGGTFPDRGAACGFGRLVRSGSDSGYHGTVCRRLHRENGIAGVDRPLEPPGAFGAHDIAELAHAKERRNPRYQVLAEGGRRTEDVGVIGGQFTNLGRRDRGQGKPVCRVIDPDDGCHARKRRRLCCHGAAVVGEYRYVDCRWLEASGAGHALRRAGVEGSPVMFGDDQHAGHQTSSFCRRACTNSATSRTISPLARWAGGSIPNTRN